MVFSCTSRSIRGSSRSRRSRGSARFWENWASKRAEASLLDAETFGAVVAFVSAHIAPASCNRERISTREGSFIESSRTVARPIGVRATTIGPSK